VFKQAVATPTWTEADKETKNIMDLKHVSFEAARKEVLEREGGTAAET
jgi:hypothetical protein